MTSQKSFKNNFSYAFYTGLRENALFAVLNAVFLALFFCVMPIQTFMSTTQTDFETGKVSIIEYSKVYAFLFAPQLQYFRYFIIAVLLGVGILMGIAAFRFITGKKTVNVYYSLGIKRQKLFAAKYLSGLTLIAGSVLVPMVVSLIANIAVLGFNKFMLPAFFYLLLTMFSLVAVSYTLTALVFSAVGTVFEGILFSGVVLLTPEILFSSMEILIKKLVFGTPLGSVFSGDIWFGTAAHLTSQFAALNPLRYAAAGLCAYSQATADGKILDYDTGESVAWALPNFLTPALWVAVAGALFVLGMVVYKRRKAEIGGFIGKNRVLNFLIVFLVAFYGFVQTYNALEFNSKALAVLAGVLVFVLIYVALTLLLLRNLRQFAKNLYTLPIQIVLTAIIFTIFATGYFGAANRIPETSEIAYAKITTLYENDLLIDGAQNMYVAGNLKSPDVVPDGKYETEKDINFIRDFHEKLVRIGRTEPTMLNEGYNSVRPVSVRIVYVLKDGKEVKRNYYGVSDALLSELQNLDKSDYYQTKLNQIFNEPLEKVEMPKREGENYTNRGWSEYNRYRNILAVRESKDIRLYNRVLGTEIQMELTDAQRQTLREALYKDLRAQTVKDHYTPENSLGLIAFGLLPEENGGENTPETVQWENGRVVEYYSGSDENSQTTLSPDGSLPQFFVTEAMTNTVNFLKSAGYYDALTATPTVQAIRVIKVSQLYEYSYLASALRTGEAFACEYIGERRTEAFTDMTGDYDGRWPATSGTSNGTTIFQTTDAKTIASIFRVAKTRYVVNPEDYIVIFAYPDGVYSSAYVCADDMPDNVKTEVEENHLNVW